MMLCIIYAVALFGAIDSQAQNISPQTNRTMTLTPGIVETVTKFQIFNEEPKYNNSSKKDNDSPNSDPTQPSAEENEDNAYESHPKPQGSFQNKRIDINISRENPRKSSDKDDIASHSYGNTNRTDSNAGLGGQNLGIITLEPEKNPTLPKNYTLTKEAIPNKIDSSTNEAGPKVIDSSTESTVNIPVTSLNTALKDSTTVDNDVTASATESTANPTTTEISANDYGPSINQPNRSDYPDKSIFEAVDYNEKHHSHRAEKHIEGNHQNIPKENINDLCSSCLCDPEKTNVYCIHEHILKGSLHHLELHKGMIPNTATFLSIEGFENVTIMQGTFHSQELELRNIQFENIHSIQLMKESLLFDEKARSNQEVAVTFKNCSIKDFPTEAFIQYARSKDQEDDIHLENTRFLSLRIVRCNISTIRSYAFSQARLLNFHMSESRVEDMEQHSFHLDVYEDWAMENNILPVLVPHTICLRSQMLVRFSYNFFRGLENRSLEILSNNQVLFEFNRVSNLGSEALMGITPRGRGANLVFMNNTVMNLSNKSLIISNRYPIHERKLLGNNFNVLCDCSIEEEFLPLMDISELSTHQDNQTYNKLLESSSCKRYPEANVYNNIEEYRTNNCAPIPLPIIVSAGAVVTVVIITIIVCIVCTKRAEKAKEEANYLGECCYSQSFSTLNSGNPASMTPLFSSNLASTSPAFSECGSWERSQQTQPWVIAVPEVKTYQETEVNIRYEQTDPLNASIRGSYQEPEIYFQKKVGVRASCPFN